MSEYTEYYQRLHADGDIPPQHKRYITGMRDKLGIQPRVIYDVGAAVLHWTRHAQKTWPGAQVFAFDALSDLAEFYEKSGVPHHIAVLSDAVGREVTYYAHPMYLGGNSYYRENVQYSPAAATIYSDNSGRVSQTDTIDNIVAARGFPFPDLIKFDVQGAELDILRGMPNALQHVQHMIVELQHVEYNLGAKRLHEALPIIESLGFQLQHPSAVVPAWADNYFCGNGPDSDYHFIRVAPAQ